MRINSHKFLSLLFALYFPTSANCQQIQVSNLLDSNKPLFIKNKGQVTDQNGKLRSDVKYMYCAPGFKLIMMENSFSYELYTIRKEKGKSRISEADGKPVNEMLPDKFKEPEEVTISTSRVDLELKGANPHPEIIPEGESSDYRNYYLAHTPEAGVTNVHPYSKVTYRNIYPNIDFVFYAREDGKLKYDIVIYPGGQLSDLKMKYKGMNSLWLSRGMVHLCTREGKMTEEIPISYIKESGEGQKISYSLKDNTVSFKGDYDRKSTLIIDPLLRQWSTYYGGSSEDYGNDVAIDESNNIFLVGYSFSSSGIASSGAYQAIYGGVYDALLVKFNSNGGRQWATYYGGSGSDYGNSVAVDSSGNILFVGHTSSPSGLGSVGAYQTYKSTTSTDMEAFLVKFNTNGSRVWGTYYGWNDNDYGNSIAIDKSDNIYLGGRTSSLKGIATSSGYQISLKGSADAFLVKFSSNGSRQWATYYGGNGMEYGNSIATDRLGNVFLGGFTNSTSGIASSNGYQSTFGGSYQDGFLVKFDSAGARKWATYFGGNGSDYGYSVATDDFCNVFLGGYTTSASGIATSNAYLTTQQGNYDAFLAKLDSSGSIKWATYYGGYDFDQGYSAITDKFGNVFFAGYTNSWQGIASSGAYKYSLIGSYDAFIVKFDSSGKRQWGTYYGGNNYEEGHSVTLDRSGNVILTGFTNSTPGISSTGSYQPSFGGNYDGFLVKFNDVNLDAGVISIDSISSSYCGGTLKNVYVKIKNFTTLAKIDSVSIGWAVNGIGQKSSTYSKIIAAGDTSNLINLGPYNFGSSNSYVLKVWTYRPNNTNDYIASNDTFTKLIRIDPRPSVELAVSNGCEKSPIVINNNSTLYSGSITYLWKFGDGTTSTVANPNKLYSSAGNYTITLVASTDKGCLDSSSKVITIYPRASVDFSALTPNTCGSFSVSFVNNTAISSGRIINFLWKFGDGTISTIANPLKSYSSAGNYSVTLITTTDKGCTDSNSQIVSVYDNPVADFKFSDQCANRAVDFLNTSTIAVGSIVSYDWSFGDNGSSSLQNPIHVYSNPGAYNVWLKTKSDKGCKAAISKQIVIYPAATVNFLASNSCVNSSISFTNGSYISSGSINSYFWKFGDGSTSTTMNPSKSYSAAGTYSVILIAVTDNGCNDSIVKQLTIYPSPDSAFLVSKEKYYDYNFAPLDTLEKSYKWQFGDGDTSSLFKAKHTYKKDGTYYVRLVVRNSYGCVSTSLQKVVVNTTGTLSQANQNTKIYPNPFTRSFKLVRESNLNEAVIEVFNLTGGRIYVATTDKVETEINLGTASSGMYWVRVLDGDKVYTDKVVKQ